MNWLVIIGVSVVAMIMAMVWFGTLFWKLWMKIHGWENMSKEELKKQEEGVWKLLAVEAVSTFIMICVLNFFLIQFSGMSPFIVALLVWGWFMVPNTISGVIWGADKKEWHCTKILVLAGFNLAVLLIASYLLSLWL